MVKEKKQPRYRKPTKNSYFVVRIDEDFAAAVQSVLETDRSFAGRVSLYTRALVFADLKRRGLVSG